MRLTIDFQRDQRPAFTVGGQALDPQAHEALRVAYEREHELVGQLQQAQEALQQGREALERMDGMLRERTIERDHAREDAHLWSLCLAYIVAQEADETLDLPAHSVNAMKGQMLTAVVDEEAGRVTIGIQPRPLPSEEGRAADG